MRMNVLCKAIAAAGMALVSGVNLAMDLSVNAMDNHVLPVFVQVNTQGKVTRILPAEPLAPKFDRMLGESIRGWIKKPAMVNGHAVDSSMIMRVALNVQPRNDGNYDLVYHYISATAVPMASAASYWRWTNNHLALVTGPDDLQDYRRNGVPYRSNVFDRVYDRSGPAGTPAQGTSSHTSASSSLRSR